MNEIKLFFQVTKLYSNYFKHDLTPLKLQKLAYYCYGFALAYDFENEVNGIEFEAWKYGPVNRKLHEALSNSNNPYYIVETSHPVFNQISKIGNFYSENLYQLISAVVHVYGKLSPRGLVLEIQREKFDNYINPWKKTYNSESVIKLIDNVDIKIFFKNKLVRDPDSCKKRTSLKINQF